jgi:hypothetical protein
LHEVSWAKAVKFNCLYSYKLHVCTDYRETSSCDETRAVQCLLLQINMSRLDLAEDVAAVCVLKARRQEKLGKVGITARLCMQDIRCKDKVPINRGAAFCYTSQKPWVRPKQLEDAATDR